MSTAPKNNKITLAGQDWYVNALISISVVTSLTYHWCSPRMASFNRFGIISLWWVQRIWIDWTTAHMVIEMRMRNIALDWTTNVKKEERECCHRETIYNVTNYFEQGGIRSFSNMQICLRDPQEVARGHIGLVNRMKWETWMRRGTAIDGYEQLDGGVCHWPSATLNGERETTIGQKTLGAILFVGAGFKRRRAASNATLDRLKINQAVAVICPWVALHCHFSKDQ